MTLGKKNSTQNGCFPSNHAGLIEPGDEMCELDSTWEDKEACLTCHCENYGFLAVCCDINPSPVISQLTKRKIC
ncbi:hypothetical protein BSL78_19544 [Apostichopus japonicus]|uniref:Pacifastin domain-containing protein n=1 Tax=Stichopus japonicus TaxID=307972 RepID=A0A2G8K6M6_STIJA|nr:hypothetical protein BSL78_19544 [Apostichopus japonicus]